MKRVIRFTKIRYIMFILSALVIIGGMTGLYLQGFNLGIDFTGGVNKQFQIAPVAFHLKYTGSSHADADISNNRLVISISDRDIDSVFELND